MFYPQKKEDYFISSLSKNKRKNGLNQVGVNLGSVQTAMPQKQGNVFDTHPVLQQVRGYRVAQYVQRKAFCFYVFVPAVALQVFCNR